MKPMEQYEQNGLEIPISLRPGIWVHLLIWGGRSFLIFSGVLVITKGDFLEKTIGVFGIMFFGTALGIMIFALLRSRERGIFELSKEGIFMSHMGLVFPWNDIGPAWIATTKNQGVTTKDVVFVLRNAANTQNKWVAWPGC